MTMHSSARQSKNKQVLPSSPLQWGAEPGGLIELFQYLGYADGFSHQRVLLWKCELVGVNNARRAHDAYETGSGRGTPDKRAAERNAAYWHSFLGWSVFDLGRRPERDEEPKENR